MRAFLATPLLSMRSPIIQPDFLKLRAEKQLAYSTIDINDPHVICDLKFTDTKRGKSNDANSQHTTDLA